MKIYCDSINVKLLIVFADVIVVQSNLING